MSVARWTVDTLPSDGSIIGSVAPLADAIKRFAMKCAGGVVIAGQWRCGAFMASYVAKYPEAIAPPLDVSFLHQTDC